MSHGSQFHATLDELLALASQLATELRPRLVATEFPPERSFDVAPDELPAVFARPRVDALAFVFPNEPGAPRADDGEDQIHLWIAREKGGRLRQSAIGTRSQRPDVLAAWKVAKKRLVAMTGAGATVRNPTTGDSGHNRDIRHTEGARARARQGIVMLPFAGNNHIEFDAPKK